MPRCYTIKKTNGQQPVAQQYFKAKDDATSLIYWQNAPLRKLGGSNSAIQRKKKDDAGPVSPTEASVAPIYYNGTSPATSPAKGGLFYYHINFLKL